MLEAGHIVGIINRSDITQYSMAAYLADIRSAPSTAVRAPPASTSAWKRPARSVKFKQPRRARATGLLAFGKPRGQLPWVKDPGAQRCGSASFGHLVSSISIVAVFK